MYLVGKSVYISGLPGGDDCVILLNKETEDRRKETATV